RFTGKTPFDIHTMKLTRDGFDLTFTQPVTQAALDTATLQVRHYYYDYYKKDLSEPVDKSIQIDVQEVAIEKYEISDDGKVVSLILEDLKPGYIYELKADNLYSSTKEHLVNNLICYTLNHLK